MSALHISNLRCDYLVAPLGIDERAPRLSWQLDCGDRRGARQVAYRIRVASTAESLAKCRCDRWDSGRIESAQTTHVVYAGAELRSRETCAWDVEVWDDTGASARSTPSAWSMGLLEACDWEAQWIAADPAILTRDQEAIAPSLTDPGTPGLFRREFEVPAPVIRATLYASARGVLELRANGRGVTDDLFAPEWTDYDRRIHYRTYDVTSLLAPGANCLAATLGDGWWSGYVGWQETRGRYDSLENSLMLQLEIELADGRRMTVCTDDRWRCNTGPILQSDFQMGETYDARRERTGWDAASFDARAWLPAREVAAPRAALVAQRSEPVRVIEELAPVSITEHRPGVFICDFGQNISGNIRLDLREFAAGTRLTLRHGERLSPDGSLYTENLRRAKATDTYVARGDASESYAPHFTFHGFQYLELTARAPGECHPLVDTSARVAGPGECHHLDDIFSSGRVRVTARVIHSATPPAGHFECSHAGVNRLWLNGLWSQRDNFLSVPTDCPQRDERLGWMGDAQVFIRTATCNMDVAAFFTKWMVDVEDAQNADGMFPDVAPRIREDVRFVGLDDLCGGAGWADAGVIVPWTIWRVYGDTRIVERHWDAMVRWLDYLERTNPDGLRTRDLRNNYGDWLCIPTDTSFRTHSPMKNLLATAYWADDAAKMAAMARALGREAETSRYRQMFEKVRAAFQLEFVREDGRLAVETQTAYLLALAFDLLPHHLRARATEHLVENIRALNWHLSTGFIGISHLNPQLTLNGHADVAYRLLLQETYPGWLYPVKHGATTIWERWNGWTHQDGFFNPHMNSFNHYSLGSVGEWLFRHVAGIELDPEAPGYQRFVLRPFVGAGLDFARATLRTMHGEIESGWRREGGALTWSIRVPANTTARVFIPSDPDTPVESDGLAIVGREGTFAVCEASAGRYTFHSSIGVD
ncbi:MAG: glycoside hydrolase family 78 protein [Opitutaceae bacterium]|nr:glycoside hydrolase family 78 protein [Opitutaceae bacterium]